MTCSPLLNSAHVHACVFPAVHCVTRVAFRRFALPQLYTEHSKILLWELSAFLLHPWPFLLNNRDGNIVSLEYIIWMTGTVDWYGAVDAWITLKLHLCAHSLRKWMPRLFLHGLSDFALFFFFLWWTVSGAVQSNMVPTSIMWLWEFKWAEWNNVLVKSPWVAPITLEVLGALCGAGGCCNQQCTSQKKHCRHHRCCAGQRWPRWPLWWSHTCYVCPCIWSSSPRIFCLLDFFLFRKMYIRV